MKLSLSPASKVVLALIVVVATMATSAMAKGGGGHGGGGHGFGGRRGGAGVIAGHGGGSHRSSAASLYSTFVFPLFLIMLSYFLAQF
ncbi:hypothetical protein RHMOL_Rhmol09G0048300 [Rhododendron molle]|uniref:Uncharacterized protein n=1 Tax=Rhododendron molle TaxID=49168 RepID=A0ACC0MBG6_RHOML|nr:hypothetical protein RHMOL_Rhmol09G0048300 [Rhododendron molle]